MRICLALLLVLPLFAVIAAAPEWQDGVMVQKKGSSYIFIFPATQSRITASFNPTGEITVNRSIAVMYALKILRGGRTRFIGLDGSTLSAEEFAVLKPRLSTTSSSKTVGFVIRDSIQPTMHVHIEPSFMAGRIDTQPLEQRIAREGNLTVIFGVTRTGVLRIVQAILD